MRNDGLYSIIFYYIPKNKYFSNQIEFDLKSINQELLLFRKSLNKKSIQYLIV